jgi:hypothetical protein
MKIALHNKIGIRCRLFLQDVKSGVRRQMTDWTKNMVFDVGLNLLAQAGSGAGFYNQGNAGFFQYCQVGSGATANSINSGGSAIFTQTATTVTSSTVFFTSAMIGGILKYGATGSSGVEQYISAVAVGGLSCTVSGAGMSQTSIAGTVWLVQQTGLETPLYQTQTVQAGANGSTFASNIQNNTRTFVFPVQGSPYSVNEVGYSQSNNMADANGRIVLGSTTVVPTSDFLVVEMEQSITQNPSAPVAVGNVGTNVNTAGMAMLQQWCGTIVRSDGSTSNFTYGSPMDSQLPSFAFHTANDITLSSSILSGTTVPGQSNEAYVFNFGNFSNAGQPVGVGVAGVGWSLTSAGETVYFLSVGTSFGGSNWTQFFVIQLTTPFTLPVGTFAGNVTMYRQFSRTLSN